MFCRISQAIQDLTIDDSERLLVQNQSLEDKLKIHESLEAENKSLQKQISEIMLDLEKVKKHQKMTSKYDKIKS